MARHEQLGRLLAVAKALSQSRRGVALARLADQGGWKLRALYRDIATLEAAGFLVEHHEGRYRLLDGVMPVASAGVSERELLALFLARRLAAPLRTTSLGRSLDALWSKLDAVRGSTGRLLPAEPATLSIRSPLAIDYAAHARTIAVLERAVAQRLAISCRYLALSTGQLTSRIVEPGELYFDPGLETLYLIGWCRLRGEVRIFAAHRFRMVALTEERVAPRGEATSSAALRDAFRVWRSGAVTRVTVEFRREAAPEIRERKWHPTQELEERPGGALRLTVQVSGTEEIERWVLGFGERARVTEPAALAARIGRRLAEAAEEYRGESGEQSEKPRSAPRRTKTS